jgi:hypothetical protein
MRHGGKIATLAAAALVAWLAWNGAQADQGLKSPDAFSSIADPAQRSVALFIEAGKVITSPRCVNCHPSGNRPLQGDDSHLHSPAVQRGDAGMGVPGLYCTTCHGPANYDAVHMPGNPAWHLAPIEMAWAGHSLAQICLQIKDPARNGGRKLADIVDHMAHDDLVGWGWHPDKGRTPAPGSQTQFGGLIQAWVETGAACPTSD